MLPKLKIKKRTHAQSAAVLKDFIEEIEKDKRARDFEPEGLEAFSREFCERHGWKARELFTLLRIAVSGRTAAPSLFDTMALVGKDRARMRIREVIELLKAQPEEA